MSKQVEDYLSYLGIPGYGISNIINAEGGEEALLRRMHDAVIDDVFCDFVLKELMNCSSTEINDLGDLLCTIFIKTGIVVMIPVTILRKYLAYITNPMFYSVNVKERFLWLLKETSTVGFVKLSNAIYEPFAYEFDNHMWLDYYRSELQCTTDEMLLCGPLFGPDSILSCDPYATIYKQSVTYVSGHAPKEIALFLVTLGVCKCRLDYILTGICYVKKHNAASLSILTQSCLIAQSHDALLNKGKVIHCMNVDSILPDSYMHDCDIAYIAETYSKYHVVYVDAPRMTLSKIFKVYEDIDVREESEMLEGINLESGRELGPASPMSLERWREMSYWYANFLQLKYATVEKIMKYLDTDNLNRNISTRCFNLEKCLLCVYTMLERIQGKINSPENVAKYFFRAFVTEGISFRILPSVVSKYLDFAAESDIARGNLACLLNDVCDIGFEPLSSELTDSFDVKFNKELWLDLYMTKCLPENAKRGFGLQTEIGDISDLLENSSIFTDCDLLVQTCDLPEYTLYLVTQGLHCCKPQYILAGISTVSNIRNYIRINLNHLCSLVFTYKTLVSNGIDKVLLLRFNTVYKDVEDHLLLRTMRDWASIVDTNISYVELMPDEARILFPEYMSEESPINDIESIKKDVIIYASAHNVSYPDVIKDVRRTAPEYLKRTAESNLLLELWSTYKKVNP